MKNLIVIIASVAAVQAQSLSDTPACARPCIADSIQKVTSCAVTDLSCVCQDFDKIRGDAAGCAIGACGADTGKVLDALQKLCEGV